MQGNEGERPVKIVARADVPHLPFERRPHVFPNYNILYLYRSNREIWKDQSQLERKWLRKTLSNPEEIGIVNWNDRIIIVRRDARNLTIIKKLSLKNAKLHAHRQILPREIPNLQPISSMILQKDICSLARLRHAKK